MVRDAAALVGLALVGAGCWLLSPAWALIVVGGLILAACAWGHLHDPPAPPKEGGHAPE